MKLIVAEKPDVAKSIAGLLRIPIKYKVKSFENDKYIITWCYGHLVDLSLPPAYGSEYAEKWSEENLAHYPLIPAKWKYEVSKGKEEQYEHVKMLMHRSDVELIICATDPDREGEAIYRRIHNFARCTKPVKRYWQKSNEEDVMAESFRNLLDYSSKQGAFQSATCRAYADWLIGMNGSPLYSITYHTSVSTGRVQTPVLRMIVDRDYKVENFIKEFYYTAELECGGIKASGARIDQKYEAEKIRDDCDHKNATIQSIESKKKNSFPSKLYNLSGLQRDASRYFGYTAKQTLDLAQKLYENKLLTYPRSSNKFITSDMENTVMNVIPIISQYYPFYKNGPMNTKVIINDKAESSHTALLPTKQAADRSKIEGLSKHEKNIFDLVAIRLLCAVDAPKVDQETVVTIISTGAPDYPFTAKEVINIEKGYTEILENYEATFKKSNRKPPTILPKVEKGAVFVGVSSVKEHETAPPKRYTDGTIIEAMLTAGNEYIEVDIEKPGLGTEATRDSIIEKLLDKKLIQRDKKNLISTNKGRKLIEIVPEILKSPKTTAEWENKLYEIEMGRYSPKEFMDGINQMIRNLFDDKEPLKDVVFDNNLDKEVLGSCPRCKSNVYESKVNFYCSNKECDFSIFKEDRFFKALRKKVTKTMVKDFLKKGHSTVDGLYSKKKDKKYKAIILMKEVDKNDGSGGKWVNFEHDFSNPARSRKKRTAR